MKALTREPKTSWIQPMPQKGATNRFAVLADPDTHGTASAASRATSEAQRKTTGRSTELGKRKNVSWSQALEWCWYTRVPRVQYLMEEEETKSVCATARDNPRAGFRLLEAVVDSGAEESVTPPNVFPGEIHASAMSKTGGKYKAANGTRIPNLGQQKVRFNSDEGQVCGMGFQVADVERPLIAASQLASAGNRVTFEAQGGEIEHIKSGRYVLRMWVAAKDPSFPGPGK